MFKRSLLVAMLAAVMGAIFKLEWSIAKQLRKVDCDANAKQSGQKPLQNLPK